VAQLVNDLVLKELAGLIGGGADTSRNIDAPPFESHARVTPTDVMRFEGWSINVTGGISPTANQPASSSKQVIHQLRHLPPVPTFQPRQDTDATIDGFGHQMVSHKQDSVL